MKNLFKKVLEENRKAKFIHVRVSGADAEIIAASAKERNLNVCEFMRRAALGRRADVRFETEIVLQLKDIIQAIRILHSFFLELGISPDEETLGLVVDEALSAMKRICK